MLYCDRKYVFLQSVKSIGYVEICQNGNARFDFPKHTYIASQTKACKSI